MFIFYFASFFVPHPAATIGYCTEPVLAVCIIKGPFVLTGILLLSKCFSLHLLLPVAVRSKNIVSIGGNLFFNDWHANGMAEDKRPARPV
jgi:hypothetical protein